MNKTEIFNTVEDLLVNNFAIDRKQIKLEATLADDLDIDSIDAIELILNLEDKYGEKIPAEDLKAARTVKNVVDTLHVRLNGN